MIVVAIVRNLFLGVQAIGINVDRVIRITEL